jgi:hypothetical protein
VLTQSFMVIMSRMPIGISNETVVDRTILFLTPLLKSAAPGASFPSFLPL